MYDENAIRSQIKSKLGKNDIRFRMEKNQDSDKMKQVSNGKNRNPQRDQELCEESIQC
jgi:hypothetical protein